MRRKQIEAVPLLDGGEAHWMGGTWVLQQKCDETKKWQSVVITDADVVQLLAHQTPRP